MAGGSGFESVTDAANGADVPGSGGRLAELAAQIGHVHVDDVVVAEPVVTPDLCHQYPAPEDPTRRGRQRIEQVELDPGQLHRLSTDPDLPRMHVDHQIAEIPELVAHHRLSWPPLHRLDAHRQLPGGERLGDVIVGADSEAEHAVEFLVTGGQHDDVGVAELPHPAAHLDA